MVYSYLIKYPRAQTINNNFSISYLRDWLVSWLIIILYIALTWIACVCINDMSIYSSLSCRWKIEDHICCIQPIYVHGIPCSDQWHDGDDDIKGLFIYDGYAYVVWSFIHRHHNNHQPLASSSLYLWCIKHAYWNPCSPTHNMMLWKDQTT